MDPIILEKAGLSKGEASVYLALLKLGYTKTGPLAKEAGVSSSKVYKILDRLIKKGLVGHIVKGKIKYFQAMEPKRVIEYMREKEEQMHKETEYVKTLLPQLEAQRKLNESVNAVIYEGAKACTNFFKNIIDELKPNEEYYVIGASYGETENIRLFFHKHHLIRAEKKIKLNMLASSSVKNNLEPTTLKNANVKYLPQELTTKMEIVFYKDKVFIVLWKESPIGFFIQDQETASSFLKYFHALSKMAEK